MAGLRPWGGAPLLLALLFPLALPSEGAGEAPATEAPAAFAAPPLPLVQMLLSRAPPKFWLRGRSRRRASEQPLRYMRDLYRSVTDRHGRPRTDGRLSSNTIRLVRPSAKARQAEAGPWFSWALDYRLEVQVPAQRLVRAVAVFVQHLSSPHGSLWCTATPLPGGSALPQGAASTALLKEAVATPDVDSWAELDLSSHLRPWTWATQKSQLLRLRHACTSLGGAWSSPLSLEDPFLLLYLNDTRKPLQGVLGGESVPAELPQSFAHIHRMRRAEELEVDQPGSGRRRPSTKQSDCALHPFRVTFRQLGWDHWIIAPHAYRPQYCKGACPRVLRYGYHSPNHAIVQNLINESVDPNVPRPSCVPSEYGPVGVLMIEQNSNILFKVYEDMIAKSCTCR